MNVNPTATTELRQRPAAPSIRWEIPDEGIAVHLNENLIGLLQRDAARAGDKMIAGVLLGRTSRGRQLTLNIEHYEAATPEDGAVDSPFSESQRMESILQQWRPGQRRLSVVGYYRTCTHAQTALDSDDLAFLEAHATTAPGPAENAERSLEALKPGASAIPRRAHGSERVFLLIERGPGNGSSGVLFLSRGGTVEFRSPSLPFDSNKDRDFAKPNSAGTFGAGEARIAPIEPGARIPREIESSGRSEKQPFKIRSLNLTLIALGICVILISIFSQLHGGPTPSSSPTPPASSGDRRLGLKVERSGEAWQLGWDPNSPVVLAATKGHLLITDGTLQKDLDLSLSELHGGTVMYTPITDDVVLRLEVESPKSPDPISESVRIIDAILPAAASAPVQNASSLPAINHPLATASAQPENRPVAYNIVGQRQPAPQPGATAASKPVRSQISTTEPPVRSGKARIRTNAVAQSPITTLSGTETPMPSAHLLSSSPVELEASSSSPRVEAGQPTQAQTPSQNESGGVFQVARLILRADPEYPESAKQDRLSGSVDVQFRIDTDGQVRNVTVVKGSPVLAKVVVEAVQQWRYRPATVDGVPTITEGGAVFDFSAN